MGPGSGAIHDNQLSLLNFFSQEFDKQKNEVDAEENKENHTQTITPHSIQKDIANYCYYYTEQLS